MNELLKWVEALATPVGLPAILLFAIWRFSKWILPKLDEMFHRHMRFVDSVQNCMEKQTENSERQTAAIRSIEANVGEQSAVLKSIKQHLAIQNGNN